MFSSPSYCLLSLFSSEVFCRNTIMSSVWNWLLRTMSWEINTSLSFAHWCVRFVLSIWCPPVGVQFDGTNHLESRTCNWFPIYENVYGIVIAIEMQLQLILRKILPWKWPKCGSKHVAIYCEDLTVILINGSVDSKYILICNNIKHKVCLRRNLLLDCLEVK
jgi:hypothetical protein